MTDVKLDPRKPLPADVRIVVEMPGGDEVELGAIWFERLAAIDRVFGEGVKAIFWRRNRRERWRTM